MDSKWNNSTCNSCRANEENYEVDDGSGDVYCRCGECPHNPIMPVRRKPLIGNDDDDDEDF